MINQRPILMKEILIRIVLLRNAEYNNQFFGYTDEEVATAQAELDTLRTRYNAIELPSDPQARIKALKPEVEAYAQMQHGELHSNKCNSPKDHNASLWDEYRDQGFRIKDQIQSLEHTIQAKNQDYTKLKKLADISEWVVSGEYDDE